MRRVLAQETGIGWGPRCPTHKRRKHPGVRQVSRTQANTVVPSDTRDTGNAIPEHQQCTAIVLAPLVCWCFRQETSPVLFGSDHCNSRRHGVRRCPRAGHPRPAQTSCSCEPVPGKGSSHTVQGWTFCPSQRRGIGAVVPRQHHGLLG